MLQKILELAHLFTPRHTISVNPKVSSLLDKFLHLHHFLSVQTCTVYTLSSLSTFFDTSLKTSRRDWSELLSPRLLLSQMGKFF